MKKSIFILLILLLSGGIIMARCHNRDCCECDGCYDDYYNNCCDCCDCYDGYNYSRRCYHSGYRYYTVYYPTRRTSINIRGHYYSHPSRPMMVRNHHPQPAAAARIHTNSHHPARPIHTTTHHRTGAPSVNHHAHQRR